MGKMGIYRDVIKYVLGGAYLSIYSIPDFPDATGAFETDLIVSGLWRQFKPVMLF